MKALSKSRFKLGLECPNKIYFSNNDKDYHNVKNEDTFLQALASGGFQVEEYARLQYPSDNLIKEPKEKYDYQDLADKTNELLKQENVVIFEAAFLLTICL
jgi:dethiobiotin synthetase